MRPLLHKFKPASGFSQLLHWAYRIALPLVVFVLTRLAIGLWLPIMFIMLSKWRVFAVRPRFWPANLRANSVDIIFGISIVLFMAHSDSGSVQLFWAAVYAGWLLYLKPRSSILFISLQAALSQLAALSALFMVGGQTFESGLLGWAILPSWIMVLVGGLICYLSARHFFESFSEPYSKLLSYIWGYFGAALTWLLAHMLIVYPKPDSRIFSVKPDGIIAMPTLLLCIISYSLAAIYYLEHFDRLSRLFKREILFLGGAVVLILMVSLYYEGAHLIV